MRKLRRYEFSEKLADILRESRRDLRYRVTMLVASGLVPPGARGPGSPPATPAYAANLLIGVIAAPTQSQTVEATRCYRDFEPTVLGADAMTPRISLRPVQTRVAQESPGLSSRPLKNLRFGDALSFLLEEARCGTTRPVLARELYGVWVNRGCPVAAIQFGAWLREQRTLVTQRYEIPEGAPLPAWLDPQQGGTADPGLLHSVFLPARKFIEIATLTSESTQRPSPMVNLGPAVNQFAKLVHNRRYRRPWERFLTTVNAAQELAEKLDTDGTTLREVPDFGANPGNLRMHYYVPDQLPPSAPLVVVLHGCNQTAASYDYGTGWSNLAERYGFALLLPQQRRSNNPMRCFNWFKPEDRERGAGEPQSIAQMISHILTQHDLDADQIHITGLSAGGAMTSVMLATYPELFAGGAILSGVPYRAATGLQEAFDCIFKGRTKPSSEWGELVRSASTHRGPWPRVSIWHGESDATVTPLNAREITKQWSEVHGLETEPTLEREVEGHLQSVWRDENGRDTVELFMIKDMGHGAAVDPDGTEPYGVEAPFMLNVGISSSLHIAGFWGLTAGHERASTPPVSARGAGTRHESAKSGTYVGNIIEADWIEETQTQTDSVPGEKAVWQDDDRFDRNKTSARPAEARARDQGSAGARGSERPRAGSLNLNAIIRGALDVASGQRPYSRDTGGNATSAGIGGVDIQGILSKSFEAAGLLKRTSSEGRAHGGKSTSIHGIDIAGIIATSLEAAGLVRGAQQRDETPVEEPEQGRPDRWKGSGWRLLADDRHAPVEGPLLFGHATSGTGGEFGSITQTVSCQVSLRSSPRLRYYRCLDLHAAANALTSASFSVLVDGVRVDDVSVMGMDYADTEWTEKADIDLSAFADRTVEMTFEVVASSNLCVEVNARAWVGGIKVEDAVMVTDT